MSLKKSLKCSNKMKVNRNVPELQTKCACQKQDQRSHSQGKWMK